MTGVLPLTYAQSRGPSRGGAPVRRITRDVWLPMPVAAEDVPRWSALLTVLPTGSVLSGRTAGSLHGLWLGGTDRPVDVTVPTGVHVPRRRGVRAHRRRLGPGETAEVVGVPVTSLARTWCDLAEELSLPDLVAAGDSALQAGATPADLGCQVVAAEGCPGVRLARRALPLLDARSRSRPESHLRVTLATAGLPLPAVNEAISDGHGGWLAEPDLSYPAARLAVEYQGADHALPARMRRDVSRHMDLRRAGWEVLDYVAAQVFGRPETVAQDVLAVLRERAPHLLAARGGRRPTRAGSREVGRG